MMRCDAGIAFVAMFILSVINAVAIEGCATTTIQVIVPTTTYTYLSTYVVTEQATTALDLGTFTDVSTIRSIKTLKDVTSTMTDCIATQTFTSALTATVYTSNNATPLTTPLAGRDLTISDPIILDRRDGNILDNTGKNILVKRQESACVVTYTSITTYGATYTRIPANKTSTYTRYTQFSMKTISRTTYTGTTYTIGTPLATTCMACGPTVSATASIPTTTITQDARCAPTALVSAAGSGSTGSEGFGILYLNDVPYGGAVYRTNTTDPSECCQLCVEEQGCAASAWDIRTSQCRLLFSSTWDTGLLNCGMGALAFYNYGPNRPMKPGSGWFIGTGCGQVQFAGAKPDDGS